MNQTSAIRAELVASPGEIKREDAEFIDRVVCRHLTNETESILPSSLKQVLIQ
jgi:hypothetical protein